MADLLLIDLDKIDDHPDNPRIAFRQDVVDAIVANLNGEWPQQHALHVRPVDGRYQVLSGHHRKRAASQRGIAHVWCWVEDMDDEDAFMCLVTENSQGELSPLEYGMHALEATDKGKWGNSAKAYEERLGIPQGTMKDRICAARVVKVSGQPLTLFAEKTQHLSTIHSAPQETWPALCEVMAEEQADDETAWTVKHTDRVVADIRTNGTSVQESPKAAVKAASRKARLPQLSASGAHVSHNSGENEWYTPPEFIEAAREVLGAIDLDPASSEIAQRTVQAGTFYTKDDDGLTKDWAGRVWMNPPYSHPLVGQFCDKISQEAGCGKVSEAIVLVNNATETQWFRAIVPVASAICFIAGRIKFLDQDGNPGAPLQGQAAIYLGTNPSRFAESFCKFGFVTDIARQHEEACEGELCSTEA
jgi:ParB family chromosome partitioning protein